MNGSENFFSMAGLTHGIGALPHNSGIDLSSGGDYGLPIRIERRENFV